MPTNPRILSEDRITGEIAPVGYITGFPRPRIKSAWPDFIGKPEGKKRTKKAKTIKPKKPQPKDFSHLV